MLEIEDICKALECRKNRAKRCGNPCEETGACHYAKAVRAADGYPVYPFVCDTEQLCADVLELLKEQEAIKSNVNDVKAVECLKALQIINNYLDEEEQSCNHAEWIDKKGFSFRGDMGYFFGGLASFENCLRKRLNLDENEERQ